MIHRIKKKNLPLEVAIAFQSGETWAYERIHADFRDVILRFISRRVPNDECAQDLCQEVFLKAYRFRESYRPDHSVSTWLKTIARNTVTDWRRGRASAQAAETIDANLIEEQPCSRPHSEAWLEIEFRKKQFLQLLKKLTAVQRRVIWFRVVHHLSYQEIAQKLGLSLSAVKCLAYRARQSIAEMDFSPAFA